MEYHRGSTVYHRFYSPFLFPTIEDNDDDGSDQTTNSKKNAEDCQRVLVWHPRVRIISVAAGRFG